MHVLIVGLVLLAVLAFFFSPGFRNFVFSLVGAAILIGIGMMLAHP
jgi:hypothetical protein